MNQKNTINPEIFYLIYDGDCLLCQHIAKATRLRKSVQQFELINAREHHPLVTTAKERGYNLNQGIVIFYQNHVWGGAKALHRLACLITPINTFNRVSVCLFRHAWVSYCAYPFLLYLRRILLWLRNKKTIKHA